MKDSRPHLSDRQPFTPQLPTMSAETTPHSHQADALRDPQCQRQYTIEEALLDMSPSPLSQLPSDYEQLRISRERADRTTVEDKVRRAIDSWTAEERATAYWYLYACGMTLDRAKAIRHKGGFTA